MFSIFSGHLRQALLYFQLVLLYFRKRYNNAEKDKKQQKHIKS